MMPYKLIRPLMIVSFVMIYQNSFGQEIIYHAFRNGNKIGVLTVNQNCEGERCKYLLNNKVTIKFLITVDIELQFACLYQKGSLIYADIKELRNGSVRDKSYLCWQKDKYLFSKDTDTTTIQLSQQSYSTTVMYFKEPVGLTEVFSERFGKYLDLKQIDTHTYDLVLPNNSTNTFFYENGECNKIHINHTMGKVELFRIN